MAQDFFGSKGGGGAAAFRQRPDSLRSNDVFEGVLGICAGPIKGLRNGLKSLKLNGTPIEDASNVLNFPGMVVSLKDGDPANFPQTITLALGAGGAPSSVGLTLTNTDTTGSVPGPWVTKTMTNQNASFIDMRFVVQQLYTQDKTGVLEATANLEIQLKPSGATTWINPNLTPPISTYSNAVVGGEALYSPRMFYDGGGAWLAESNSGYLAISGKTTSAYVKELRVSIPNTGAYIDKSWDIRIRLREPASIDADPVFTKRTVQWESISAGYPGTLGTLEGWRGVSSLRVFGKSTDEFNGVPMLEGEYDTKIVSVPPIAVYNPDTRQYTGTLWDGSFSKAFTTDPAWIINDVLSDGLFGMSGLAPGSYLNKWDALEVSKWCSTLVSDGNIGTQPRYCLNFRSQNPQKATEYIQYLAGAVGGFAWDNGNGEWRIKLDKPEAPSDIITLETIEGEFSYAHTDVSSRYNDITMTFLNEEFGYREDRVRVFDATAIALYGRKPTTLVAIGATNRHEVVRRATLRLRAATKEIRTVSYSTNRRGKLLTPFATVLIADGDLGYTLPVGATLSTDVNPNNNRTSGRVVETNVARTVITLRDTVRLELGVTYTLHYAVTNPNYTPEATTEPTDSTWDQPTITQTRVVTNTAGQRGDVTTLYLSSALPTGLPEYLSVAIEATGLPTIPKMYRVLSIAIDDQNNERCTVSCIEVDTGKWAAADSAPASPPAYQVPSVVVPPPLPPTSGAILTQVRIPGNGPDIINVVVNWQRPASRFLTGFKIQYRLNGGPVVVVADNLNDTTLEMVNPAEGSYSFEIFSRDRRGVYSLPLTATLAPNNGVDDPYVATASVSAEMVPDKIVAADYLGVVTALNLANLLWTPRVVKGGTSIKIADTTLYTLSGVYGGVFAVSNTLGATNKGDITTSSILAQVAGGDLTVTVAGVALPKIGFKVTKDPALAPPPTGSTSISFASGEMLGLNTVSYTSIFNVVKTIPLVSGESLYGTAPLDYYVSGTTFALRSMTFKWQYSVAGANVWSDFGVGIVGSNGESGDAGGPPYYEPSAAQPGVVAVTQTKSGLATGSYDIRMVALCSNTGRTCTPQGQATLVVKI